MILTGWAAPDAPRLRHAQCRANVSFLWGLMRRTGVELRGGQPPEGCQRILTPEQAQQPQPRAQRLRTLDDVTW